MSKSGYDELSRRGFLAATGALWVAQTGCGDDGSNGSGAGSAATGGAGGSSSGGGAGGLGGVGGASGSSGGGSAGAGATGGGDGGPKPLAGVARGSDVEDSVRRAIALVGGLGFAPAGKTVMLKPNLNSGDPSPYSPHPEIVRTMIAMLKDLGAAKIIVADRSNPSFQTFDAMTKSGILQVVKDAGVVALDLADHGFKKMTPAGATSWPSGYELSSGLDQADFLINLCNVKHHSMAGFSMALKNWMGLISQSDRSFAHGDLGSRVPDLHLARPASFTVLDATGAVLTKGPFTGGQTAKTDLVVATKDPIACDAVGLAILKRALATAGVSSSVLEGPIWQQPQLVRALGLGIGIGAPSGLTLGFDGVAEMSELSALLAA